MNKIVLSLLLLSFPLFGQLPFNEELSSDLKINSFVYGTLLKPATPTSTLAIIISGSGATDRDGNSQMARNNSLKKLAKGLAAQGIASFRYDKRVLTLMRKGALQEEKLVFDDFVSDAVAAAQFFIDRDQYDKIYFIGHSQGALVATIAAQKVAIDGVVSLSGAGQSIDQTIISQIELQMPDLKENAIAAFNTLKEDGSVKDFSPALASIFRAEVQPFMASWMQYNPRREIRKLKVPTLIISGTKDLQVAVSEAQLLKKAKPDAELILIEGMNHVLVFIEGDDLENSKSYNQTSRSLSPELLTQLSSFLKG
ncbi:MAG: alpha/beta fold hydrolase [Dokdonia sp.]|jgi:pimeloyl-ACP methyl ester carboxylesterase